MDLTESETFPKLQAVYVNKPTTTRELKEEIQRCSNEVQPHLFKMETENLDKPVHMCMQSRGAVLSVIPLITIPTYFMI